MLDPKDAADLPRIRAGVALRVDARQDAWRAQHPGEPLQKVGLPMSTAACLQTLVCATIGVTKCGGTTTALCLRVTR